MLFYTAVRINLAADNQKLLNLHKTHWGIIFHVLC